MEIFCPPCKNTCIYSFGTLSFLEIFRHICILSGKGSDFRPMEPKEEGLSELTKDSAVFVSFTYTHHYISRALANTV